MVSPSISPPTILLLIVVVALSSTSLAFITPYSSSCTFNGVTHQTTTKLFATRKSKSKSKDDDTSSNINPAKKAALEGVLQRIERNYGRGSIVKLGDADRMVVDTIGSGSMTLGKLCCYVLCVYSSCVSIFVVGSWYIVAVFVR